jgi:hypothetical protein
MKSKIFIIAFALIISAFNFKEKADPKNITYEGIFRCFINDKPHEISGQKGYMRSITGGKTQLSLYNNLFSKFSFFDPSIKTISLDPVTTKEVIIRYIEPGTNHIFLPSHGTVTIKELDLEKKLVSGEFEMELIIKQGKSRTIKVSKGQFISIPFEVIK